jgi:DUF971 family protein
MTAQSPPDPPWPTEIRIRTAARTLEIDFSSGESFSIPAELLRVESPSAEVQGHGAGGKRLVPGKRLVGIRAADMVGHYAVRLTFDDGHDTGLFTWGLLHRLGSTQEQAMAEYVAKLRAAGLSRD